MAELADRFPSRIVRTTRAPRRRRWLRVFLWTILILLLLIVAAIAIGVLRLRSLAIAALPQLDGDAHVAGLSAAVMVERDAHGVPHIAAASEDDLWMAQGYVTAQDRLWQLDVLRRNANGELAELMGSTLVPHDRAQRVLGFRKTAQRVYAKLGAADRERLDAYARGVNAYIDQHQDTLPPEFRLLFYKPKPWSGADSLSIGLMMVQTLDTHWPAKMAREEISADLKNAKLESDLYPVGSWRDHPPTGEVVDWSQPRPEPKTDDDEDDDRTQTRLNQQAHPSGKNNGPARVGHPSGAKAPDALVQSMYGLKPVPSRPTSAHLNGELREVRTLLGLPRCDGCAPGSNNWVVAGKHTASGRAMLSNDMHLNLSVPNIWYMADLRAPGFHAAGVTLPGMPMIIAGHNEHVAWGFTALFADVQDLYLEKLDGKGNYESVDGTWKPLSVDRETIKVRGGKDVVVDVQSTAHGPLLGPLFRQPIQPMALKWTLYDETLNDLPLYAMNKAANWVEFSAALERWVWPTQNVVYADDQGHIAYHAVGRVPMRPAGLVSVPITDAKHEWQGYIPFDGLPSAFDPPSGFLATANSRVTTDKSPYQISLEWLDPYRAERIYKSLQGREGLKPADMLAVQTDIYSEVDQELAHRFAYAIDHTAGADARLRKAADLMRSWDGKLTTDSAAASLVTETRAALWPMILEPKLGKDAGDYQWAEDDFAEEEIVMHGSADWLPKKYKTWDELLTDAVRSGMERGKAPADVSDWKYGSWHVIDLEHPLAKFLPLIGRIAGTGELPLSGDTTTVKQVGRDFGPSQRFTMDWSNIDGSTEDIVLGESGNPYSSYFRDQWSDWYGGTTFALPFTQAAVAAQARHTLTLKP